MAQLVLFFEAAWFLHLDKYSHHNVFHTKVHKLQPGTFGIYG